MGTVHATMAPPPPPPPTFVPPEAPPQQTPPTPEKVKLDLPTNPGPLEDLHKKCKDVFPMMFEGGRIIVNKGLTNHFQITHTLNMSNVTAKGYRFGATYVGTSQFGPQEASPVLLGDIDPSGNLNAQIISQFSPEVKAKMVAQIQDGKYAASQFTGEYKGTNFTATLSGGNIDIKGRSGVIVAQYLQNIQANLALGAEVAYQYGPTVPDGGVSVISVAGRYTGDRHIIAGTLGLASVHGSYYYRTNECTQVGVECETNFRIGESVASLGYQLDIPKANMVFRGTVDSNWTVGAVMEKRLNPLPFTLCLSAMLNHTKSQGRFGIGLVIG